MWLEQGCSRMLRVELYLVLLSKDFVKAAVHDRCSVLSGLVWRSVQYRCCWNLSSIGLGLVGSQMMEGRVDLGETTWRPKSKGSERQPWRPAANRPPPP